MHCIECTGFYKTLKHVWGHVVIWQCCNSCSKVTLTLSWGDICSDWGNTTVDNNWFIWLKDIECMTSGYITHAHLWLHSAHLWLHSAHLWLHSAHLWLHSAYLWLHTAHLCPSTDLLSCLCLVCQPESLALTLGKLTTLSDTSNTVQ